MSGDFDWYHGSRLLQPLADFMGLSIVETNFTVCVVAPIFFAIVFRLYLSKSTATVKHFVEVTLGVGILYFFCGRQFFYLLIQVTIPYFVMLFGPKRHQHFIVFTFCFIYLSIVHIYLGVSSSLDLTGPVMILTQRLTALAFAIHDGMKSAEQVPEEHRYLAVRSLPTVLQFYSYVFSFHSPLAVFFHYADYIAFIEDRHWRRYRNFSVASTDLNDSSQKAVVQKRNTISRVKAMDSDTESENIIAPTETELLVSSMKLGLKIVAGFLVFAIFILTLGSSFSLERMTDDKWNADHSFLYKWAYIICLMCVCRVRYFIGFNLVEAANVFIGFAFSGVDENGEPLWQLTNSMDVWEFETCTSFTRAVGCWNKTTISWLRYLVYSRTSWHPMIATFLVSSVWHGFAPGFYISAVTVMMFIQTSRLIRPTMQRLFDSHQATKIFYSISSFILVRISLLYMAMPVELLNWEDSLKFYKLQHFWLHILAMAAAILIPVLGMFLPKHSKPSSNDSSQASRRRGARNDD